MSKVFLLVSEGPTDYYVIKRMADEISKVIGRKIEIRLMSPKPDATTGHFEAHGWGGVKRTCEGLRVRSPAELQKMIPKIQERVQRSNWHNILLGGGADGIIVQMDSDVAHQIDLNNPFDPLSETRKSYSKKTLMKWIGQKADDPRLYYAISDMSLETWILATYSRSDAIFSDLPVGFNFSDISDVEDRLIKAGLPSKKFNGRKRLKKTPATSYQLYGENVAKKLNQVANECQCASDLIGYITAA